MDLSDPLHSLSKVFQSIVQKHFISSLLVVFAAAFSFVLLAIYPDKSNSLPASLVHSGETPAPDLGAFPIVEPTMRYGFAIDTFQQVYEAKIPSGAFMGELLSEHGVDYATIDQLARNARDVFNVKKLRQGKPYTILTRDSLQGADFFIYESSVYEYVVYELKDSMQVHVKRRKVDTQVHAAGGIIESSLWNAMVDNGLSFEITDKMEDALQWSIDFYHIQKGDQFKLVYDQDYIQGEQIGVGRLHAAYYKNYDNEYYAIYFDNGEHEGYYDLEGRPMKSFFLKSPVKYSRISSYYNLNRFHPILKRRRPHLGTDYAAPYGTPIYAVGNGVVTAAAYTKGNGNYVKIRHDDTYETQYLHMQRFAKGISSGVHVKQGQVIGYVGSTGLATGPHVCFRFWKNGRQINHLRLSFPPPEPLPDADLPAFYAVRDSLLAQINATPILTVNEQLVANDRGRDK